MNKSYHVLKNNYICRNNLNDKTMKKYKINVVIYFYNKDFEAGGYVISDETIQFSKDISNAKTDILSEDVFSRSTVSVSVLGNVRCFPTKDVSEIKFCIEELKAD